jgi:HEPN domain-containing protein
VSAERVIANLLRIAREDLEGARTLNVRRNRNAIYLCEQAAEKLMRAVLTSEKVHAGVRHQLDEMVTLMPDANPIKPRLREHLRYFVPIHDAHGANSCRPAGRRCGGDRKEHRSRAARAR